MLFRSTAFWTTTDRTEVNFGEELFPAFFVCDSESDVLNSESLKESYYNVYRKVDGVWEPIIETITFDARTIVEMQGNDEAYDLNGGDDFIDYASENEKHILFFGRTTDLFRMGPAAGLGNFSGISPTDRLWKNYKISINPFGLEKFFHLYESGNTYKEEFTYVRRDGRKVSTYFTTTIESEEDLQRFLTQKTKISQKYFKNKK